MFNVLETKTSREVRIQRDGGGNGENLGAVDHGARIVTDDSEDTHNKLEVTLKLDLIIYPNAMRFDPKRRLMIPLTNEALPLAGGPGVTGELTSLN